MFPKLLRKFHDFPNFLDVSSNFSKSFIIFVNFMKLGRISRKSKLSRISLETIKNNIMNETSRFCGQGQRFSFLRAKDTSASCWVALKKIQFSLLKSGKFKENSKKCLKLLHNLQENSGSRKKKLIQRKGRKFGIK